ncbi:MAG: penicillin-binding transpeptidase domain-containing protein [Lachnospiraceae bacterium]
MFDDFKDWFFNFIKSRNFVLTVVFIALYMVLLHRVFYLQIVKGDEYQETFALKIHKNVTVPSTRGKILDRNGKPLAYSELSYSVAIEDNGTYSTKKEKQYALNDTIHRLIGMIEENGDQVINDFGIRYVDGEYQFTKEGTQLLRFKADIYGHRKIDDLKPEEQLATAQEMIDYLCGEKMYRINEGDYTEEEKLKILIIRYAISSNSYKRYVKTTVASDVSEKTVAAVMENAENLQGVSIEEESLRVYPDAEYFAPIIGWIGKASSDEIEGFNEQLGEEKYELNDIVGKSGIEQYLELQLQGTKGSQVIYVDSVGNIIEVESSTDPTPGNDLYLTIDKDLQIACYNILEQKLAGILVEKIRNIKEYHSTGSAADIVIPIYDVYYALFDNHIIDVSHFSEEDATDLEKSILSRHDQKRASAIQSIINQLTADSPAAYKDLSLEMKNYMSHVVNKVLMGTNEVLVPDSSDAMYTAWHKEESISLKTYLEYAISKNWINVSKVSRDTPYLNSEEIYECVLDYIKEILNEDSVFGNMLFRYMLLENSISGLEAAKLLYEQGILDTEDDDYAKVMSGSVSAYDFFVNKIRNLEITPAMLALEPCSGGMVVTDVNTGDVLACVTYPGFDNNRLTNTMDSNYYSQLLNDGSRPMYSRATQERTAPGSTFKMVSAIAGLEEGVITASPSNKIVCRGIFEKVSNKPKCWIYTSSHGSHGAVNVVEAIRNSCNCYFYEVGYRLGSVGGKLSNETGLAKLAKYAEMFGLGALSGLELEESEPQISDETIVPSAIGQGTNNYTVSQIARYVTTIANDGTCYNLTLLDKLTDSDGNLVEDYNASVYNKLDVASSNLNAVQEGMHQVALNTSSLKDIGVSVAGKTGTAQQSQSHPNHALFVGYAPYEEPEISIAVRIANGYTSANSAAAAADVLKYYYKLTDENDVVSGVAAEGGGQVIVD